jgi:hypothetical protein
MSLNHHLQLATWMWILVIGCRCWRHTVGRVGRRLDFGRLSWPLTGKLNRAMYDIAQNREWRERGEEEIRLLQGESKAQTLLIQDITDQLRKLQEEKIAGDEVVAGTLHESLNPWKDMAPPPPGLRILPSRNTPQIPGLTPEQYPSLPQRRLAPGRVSPGIWGVFRLGRIRSRVGHHRRGPAG